MDRLIIFLLCLAFIATADARVDAMQLRLLEPYNQDLRWDNIESAPEWVNGVKPYYHKDWQMHRVLLAPRQQTTVLLPAYESLRLHHPQQNLDGKELDVYASNGTGLAVKQPLQVSTDGHSLVLSPNAATPLLIHIERPERHTGDVEVALFVSRKVLLNDIAPYRNLVWSSAHWCLLAQQSFALPELYNSLVAQQKQEVEVEGPARLALKNRLHYEQNASELIQDYRIRYWLDDHEAQELDFSTSVETSRIITVNTAIEVVGREEQAYLEIPNGRHKLVLQADRPLYLQILAQTEQDYLFKSLNNPRLPVEEIRKQGLLPSTELQRQEQQAKRIAQDNSRQAGGMVASNLLRKAALQRKDYPPGLAEAEQLPGFRSFYRDLLPSKKAATTAQFMAYFLTESLHAINRPQNDAILADQHLAEALKRVGSGYFTSLTSVANEYTLPEQQTAGSIRLVVDKRDCIPRQLRIEIDRKITDIRLRCKQELEPEAFTRSLAETALNNRYPLPSVEGWGEGIDSFHSQAAPIIATAVYELPLPEQARTIRIWQNGEPVNIAVQYRASKAFLLSEHSYLARLRDSSKQPENEWLPLQRLLQSEYRLYKASVASAPTPSFINKQASDSETILAKSAEQQQQWLEALEHWGRVVNSSSGLTQQQAQLAQANALSILGEDYLAESLRRYLSLYADITVAETAITQLSGYYQTQNNIAALQTLAAAMVIHRPNAAHSRLLLDALLKNGEYRFALVLGLNGQSQQESLLPAAYQLEWWETYQHLQDTLPPARRAFWQGLKAQHQGDYNAALNAWSAAELKPWHDYLQQGLQLRERLPQVTGQNASELYRQWAQWQQQHPGAKTTQNAPWHVKDYAGGDSYYAIERDLYAQAVRATAQRPVTLSILGPVTLNLQIRPLHPSKQPVVPIDGWLQITDNNEPYRYPFTNNLPAQGLLVTGADDLQAGSLVTLTYQVGLGLHELQLSSEQAPLSISVQELRPELALSVLPGLHIDPKQLPVTPSDSLALKTQADIPSSSPVTNLEQAQKKLIYYLASIEQHPETIEKWLTEAEQLAGRYPDDALLQSLLQRIARYSDWQPVNSIINNAGIDFVSVNGWQPESPFIRTRRALLPPIAENEQVIFADQRLVLLLTNVAPSSLHIDACLDDVPFLPESSTQLLFQVDEHPAQSLLLTDKEDWRRFTLNIPAGEHSIRIYQPHPVGNQYIKLRFDDVQSNLILTQERPYFVSTPQTPLAFYSLGPSQLRIDELNEGVTSYRYQQVLEGWHIITLPPSEGKSRSLLRVSQRMVNLQPKPVNNRSIQRTLIPVAAPEAVITQPVASDKVELTDAFKLGKQEDGTLSAGLDLVRRNNQQESGSMLAEEQFAQYRMNYRYFDEPRDSYWNTQGFFRAREHGGSSFGMDESVYFNPDWLPFTVRSNAKIIAQVPHDQLEWLGQWNIAVAQAYNLHPKTRLIPSLTFFARTMSLRTSTLARTDSEFKLKVDQDVFTPYKADHTTGLTPALTLEHKPWLDTVWTAKVAAGSNEDLNFTQPDYYSTEAHWQQLLGSVIRAIALKSA